MPLTLPEVLEQIAGIDRQLDANMGALIRVMGFSPSTPGDFQRVYDRRPDLRAKRDELSAARGAAQEIRDALQHKAWQVEQRRERAASRRRARETRHVRCGVCGQTMCGEAA